MLAILLNQTPSKLGLPDAQERVRDNHIEGREPGAVNSRQIARKPRGTFGRIRTIARQQHVLEHEGLSSNSG